MKEKKKQTKRLLKELAPIEREITTNQNANSVHDATLKLLLLLARESIY